MLAALKILILKFPESLLKGEGKEQVKDGKGQGDGEAQKADRCSTDNYRTLTNSEESM